MLNWLQLYDKAIDRVQLISIKHLRVEFSNTLKETFKPIYPLIRGFGGDTMHMARLMDSSRGPKGYSLANLTASFED